MKHHSLRLSAALSCLVIQFLPLLGCKSKSAQRLNVLCYSSFITPENVLLIADWEKENNAKVDLIDAGEGAAIVQKARIGKPKADVLIGIPKQRIQEIAPLITLHRPYQKSHFAFLIDEKSSLDPPKSFSDLISGNYRKKFILVDPRTSSVGLGLLEWTVSALGSNYSAWWKKALEEALTTASSWSSAYSLFESGEAPIVISYTTSPCYYYLSNVKDNPDWDIKTAPSPVPKALLFEEGHIESVEEVAITKQCRNDRLAASLVDYITLSHNTEFAKNQCMIPVSESVEGDEYYRWAVSPTKIVNPEGTSDVPTMLKEWEKLVL